MHHPIRVLFLCDGNADRSQMAEGLLRTLGGERFEVYSAGIEPRPLAPLAVTAMQEIGIAIDQHQSNDLNDYEAMQFDYVVTLYARVESNFLDFARDGHVLHWRCFDPDEATGSEVQKLAVFRHARDEIKARLEAWVAAVPSG